MINKLLFTVLLFIFTLNVFSQVPNYVPTNGLVGYWPFNGNANDESGNGFNMTLHNNVSYVAGHNGIFDGAINLVGQDATLGSGGGHAIFPSNFQLNSGGFSISIWVKTDEVYDAGESYIQFGVMQDPSRDVMVHHTFNEIAFRVGNATLNFLNANSMIGSWHNYILSYNGLQLSVYIDGNLFGVANNSNTLDLDSDMMAVGRHWWGSGNSTRFVGQIDDISIYNRALTPQEITILYTSTVPVSCLPAYVPTSGLVGYWPFCGNANDESGNGNNGTVNGATLTSDRNGNVNSAYSFNNLNDVITISNPNPQLNNTSKTITTWFKLPNQYNYSSLAVVKHGTAYSTGFDLAIDQNDAAYGTNNYIVVFLAGNGGAITFTTNQSELGSWVHFTATYDGSIIKLYLNGILKTSQNFSGSLDCPNDFIYFGKWDNPNVPAVVGREMDDIGIWNRALTPTEITQIYTGTTVTPPDACTLFLSEDQAVCAGTSVALSASVSSLACPTLPTNLQTGLVGYWPFCGNANDESGNGNNGTVNGATLTTDRFGNANSAYSFDGVNDYIVTNNISFANGGDYSISLWVKLNAAYSDGEPQHYLLSNAATLGGAYLNTDYNQSQFGCSSFYSDNSIGNWHHYVGIKSGNTYTLRIDNQVVGSVNNCNTNFMNGYPIFFGNSSVNTEFTNGIIDDILIYTLALSESEIQQINTLGQTSYLWSNGATTPTINVTPTSTTTYTCTTTTNGVSCTDSVTVVVNNPTVDLGNDVTACGTSTTLTAPSGYDSYLWSNGATTNTTTVSANGTYSCTVTQGGCSASDSIDVTLIDATISASDTEICAGENTILAVSLNNVTLNNNGNSILYSTTKGLNEPWLVNWPVTQGGNYQLKVFGTYGIANGSIGYDAAYIISQQLAYNQSCSGYQDTWLLQDGCPMRPTPDGYNPNHVYFYQILNSDGSVDFSYSDCCFGDNSGALSFELTELNSTSYLWSNGATTSTINISPTSTTTYTCTTTINGVSCTDSVTVVVNNLIINLGSDVTLCGTSTTLTAPTGYDSYLWSNGGTTNTTTVSANGTYSCTVTQGGCSAADSIDVTLIDATITASDSVICAGETVTLSVPQGGSSNTACAALPTNLQTGLVGYWPFCGNANDASGNGNNGTVNGATLTTDRFGSANSAYLNGAPIQTIQTNFPGISGTNSRTVALWFNQQMSNNTSDQWTLATYGGAGGGSGFGIFIFPGNNIGVDIGASYVSYNPTISLNQWHHISVTYSSSFGSTVGACNVYLDGVLLSSIANQYFQGINLNTGTGSPNLTFCGNPAFGPQQFLGKIDDIGIYNRALSASEIQQLYTLGQTTYSWSTGATTPTISVSPTSTTTYTCTTTINGVSCTDSVTVVVNNPTNDLGSDVTACGTSTTLTALSGYDSYLWSNGATTNTTTVTSNGTYTCTVTQGGCSASDSIDVVLVPLTINTTNISAAATYTWENNGQTYTSSGVYTGTTVNCETQVLNLTITPNSSTLSLQVFLDGYYINSLNPAAMTAARYNNLVASGSANPGANTDVDVITVELRSPSNLDVVAYSVSPILQTNGSVQCVFPAGALGGSFYIVVKHRAANPLWSANPIILTTSTTYDFANNLGSAYSNGDLSLAPMHTIVSSLYGIWLGELNEDGYLDATDYSNLELDIYASGYLGQYLLDGDLNGDTYVDASDFAVFESNSIYGPYEQRPYAITTNVSIGQSYQGGIVAYILQPGDAGYDANVQHGLIAAPSDQGTAQWGCTWTTAVSGAYGQAIGTGAQNTIDIMNGCSEAGIAARLCGDLVLDGYSDWYLPSLDELNKLYLNKVAIGGFAAGDFPISIYWSSTAFNNGNNDAAWGLFFYDGIQNPKAKVDYLSVRAVRAF